MYAQTILQLLNQLREDGCASQDVRLVCNAYSVAMRAFSGLVRPSGKLFLAHTVGTASVLHAVGGSPTITAAGLLHSVYDHGDFGRFRKGISSAARREVEDAVGSEVESYVARYAELAWNRKLIPTIAADLPTPDAVERGVLLMRLANEVEEYLDGGVLYLPDTERRREADRLILPFLVKMADDLGFPILASELTRVFEAKTQATLPIEFSQTPIGGCALLIPHSRRRRLRLRLADFALRAPSAVWRRARSTPGRA